MGQDLDRDRGWEYRRLCSVPPPLIFASNRLGWHRVCLLATPIGHTYTNAGAVSSCESTWAKVMSIDWREDGTLRTLVPKIPAACCMPRPQKFAEKTFVALHKHMKFVKVFSLSFPPYSIMYCKSSLFGWLLYVSLYNILKVHIIIHSWMILVVSIWMKIFIL